MGLIKFLKNKFEKNKLSDQETKERNSYVEGMDKSRKNFADKLTLLTKKYKTVNEDYFEELEEILISSDIGVSLALNIIEETLNAAKTNNITKPSELNELLVDKMFLSYAKSGGNIKNDITFRNDGPTVLLVVGVNGVGKTTSIAKLANRYKKMGKKIILGACDTFRAGAIEQLEVWADRLNIDIVKGEHNSDPSSVCYDTVKKAKEGNYDLAIIDTAGRLQTKVNLMAELKKMDRVMKKEIPDAPHESFIIIDATTGQNGVIQAKAFAECTSLSGAVITKMDGTSKGGILLAIRDELGIPVRFIGLGESFDDLKEFDLDKYLYGLTMGVVDE